MWIGLWLIAVAVMVAIPVRMCARSGAFISAADVEMAQPELAVRDARALVADRVANPAKYDASTDPASLPRSLRIRNLRYAKVHEDHVDLVIARNPDWSAGARIWSVNHRPHRDQPTRYRDIHFFRYAHEMAESVENIP